MVLLLHLATEKFNYKMERQINENIEDPVIQPEEMSDPIENQGDPGEVQAEVDSDPGIGEMRDKYLRLLAEFENYKKRTTKERIEFAKYASQELIVSLLPVMDDFDRATRHQQMTEGTTLIHQKLATLLKQKGLIEMQSTGQVFDASLHEAITEINAPENQKNTVIDTVEKGYYLHDKIIRFAKVVVGK